MCVCVCVYIYIYTHIYIYVLKLATSATPHERQRISIRIVTLHFIVYYQPVKSADISRVSDWRTDNRCPLRTRGVGSQLQSSAMWRRVVWSKELILRDILLHQTSAKKKLSRGWKQQVPSKCDFISERLQCDTSKNVHTVTETAARTTNLVSNWLSVT